MGPKATDINVDIGHLSMGNKEPCTKDWLGKDIKDSVGNDLLVNSGDAGSVSDAPDAVRKLVNV
jgi:hypothetical protein